MNKLLHQSKDTLFLTEEDLSLIQSIGSVYSVQKDELILDPSKPNDSIFVILEGCVGTFQHDSDKKNKIHSKLYAGDVFGDYSVFASDSIYAKALTNVKKVHIPADRFKKMMHEHTEVALKLKRLLSQQRASFEQSKSKSDVRIYKWLKGKVCKPGSSLKFLQGTGYFHCEKC
ncbi:Crp/Fnr family transcriptional regulator [Pseudalkalibacillus caeni]|uniref:Crp/Fnr family transcriptional regulator n=1 Tax=Exobacillus caeni TaxID=2574798 RepID=A0A5R9F367_9BACL|nr:Crp/Fnr family transcriptional regulator [Pseudalkalibacillus caeni]TLS35353.1 Crp/Fnr family transcriptional regulator [Pseudalkalibacillus caeni]